MSDAQQITLIVDGEETKVTTGTTGAELFFERRDVVVARVNGELKDLDQPLPEDAEIEGVTIDSPDGLNVLRHSTAHVMAQAVQQLRPDAKLGIGPYITDGFYFDFDVAEPFTPEDLKTLEKMMLKIINQNQKFVRRVVSEDEAREAMKNEPYKLELLGKKNDAAEAGEGVNVEVGAGDITIYDNVDRKSGDSVWCDLCRGPHLPNTKLISNAFALTRSSAAYWLGNQNNQQLQRIYGTAWPTKDALKAYQERIAEAERRDHRKLGAELDLFSFPDELGSGLPVFHPKGGIIRKAMEDYSRQRHVDAGYEFVYTPHITKGHLYEVSGHLDWYKEGMFPAMHIDAELNEDGTVRKPGQDYYLKPMNCPMHNLIFRSRGRSYRELPLRLFEFGSVYRYEKSGVVHGLTRVRGMTQDDAHIYCTREQMKDELTTTLNFVLGLLKDYGLDDFYLELSTKNEDKFVGDDATWDEATRTLAEVAEASGLELDPGSGRSRVLRPQDLRPGQGRPRPHLADVHHPAGLQPAGALRAGVPGRRRHPPAPGDDPPRPVRFRRAVHGRAHRALRRRLPGLAGPRPGGGHPGGGSLQRLHVRRRRPAQGGRHPRRGGHLLGPFPEEDPHRQQGQDPVRADRRRRGRRGRRRVLPLPRRQPGQRRAGGRGRPADRGRRPQPDQLAATEGTRAGEHRRRAIRATPA